MTAKSVLKCCMCGGKLPTPLRYCPGVGASGVCFSSDEDLLPIPENAIDAEDDYDVWLKRVGGVHVTLKPALTFEGPCGLHLTLTGHIVASSQAEDFRVELAKLMDKHDVGFVSVALVQIRQHMPQATEAS
jgi:hypothetical protein